MWDHLEDRSPQAIVKYSSRVVTDFDRDAAQFMWTGKFFISHTSADGPWCEENIVWPLMSEYRLETCFFLNQNSPGNALSL